MLKCIKVLTAAAIAATIAGAPAEADDERSFFSPKSDGKFMIRARGIAVVPDESASINGVAGADVSIDTAIVPEIDISYFFTENFALELIAASPIHTVSGRGSINGLNVGDVRLLPPTLTAQYHITQLSDVIKPYVGAGVNYTFFFAEDGGDFDDVEFEDSFGFALQFGVDVEVAEGLYLNADVKRVWLNSEFKVETGGATLRGDADINPWIFGIGAGYRF